jgi:hypothetical protein
MVPRQLQMEYPMANENSNANRTDPDNLAGQPGRSQHAVCHPESVLHQKSHKAAAAGLAGEAQQDSRDVQPSEGQPEIPKVGSRDAPGG